MKRKTKLIAVLALVTFVLSACSYNPFSDNNHTTGSPAGAAVGAAAGVGTVALFRGSKAFLVLGGITGAAIGYYVTTLRFDSGGVIQSGGQVYRVGQYVGIYIPSDKLFEPNTSELKPQAAPILDSAAAILKRYPNNNILISGNTSGFANARWEQKLSEKRAQVVAAYLWNAGVNSFKSSGMDVRKLNYVGYGDYFPIASEHTNDGLRENSHIQITSYPSCEDLHLDKRHVAMRNVGELDDNEASENQSECVSNGKEGCYKD